MEWVNKQEEVVELFGRTGRRERERQINGNGKEGSRNFGFTLLSTGSHLNFFLSGHCNLETFYFFNCKGYNFNRNY